MDERLPPARYLLDKIHKLTTEYSAALEEVRYWKRAYIEVGIELDRLRRLQDGQYVTELLGEQDGQ